MPGLSTSIKEQAIALQSALEDWCAAVGGVAQITSNIYQLWEFARMRSDKPRVLICYNGEDIRGDFEDASLLSRVDRAWVVAVTRGQGFLNVRGQQLAEGGGDMDPFYDVVELARDIIRGLIPEPNPHDRQWPPQRFAETPVDFKSIKPMQMVNGEILDGYLIHFTIGTQLQMLDGAPLMPG